MRKIKIKNIGDFSEEQANKLVRFAVLELDSRLKEGSPVDTGRFRGSWQIAENSKSAPNVFGPFQDAKTLPRTSLPPLKTNYQNEKVGNTYTLLNNLPYAEAVTYGTNLPPSWGGQFRTRSDKRAGWPDAQVRAVSIILQKVRIPE